MVKTIYRKLLAILAGGVIGCSQADLPAEIASQDFKMESSKDTLRVTSSPLNGQILKAGIPVSNAKIIRKVQSNATEPEWLVDEFQTDENGFFSIPVKEEFYSLNMVTQFVSSTRLDVEIDGELHNFWFNAKYKDSLFAENGEVEIEGLVCDLENQKIRVSQVYAAVLTKCRWSNMPK
jgi:hypothetical protein